MSDQNETAPSTTTATTATTAPSKEKLVLPAVTNADIAIGNLFTLQSQDQATKTFNSTGFATSGITNIKSSGLANMMGVLVALAASRAAEGDEEATAALATVGTCLAEVPSRFAVVAEVQGVRSQCDAVNAMRGKNPFTLGQFIENNIADHAKWVKAHGLTSEQLAEVPSA